jgi:prepilin-type N-terminal cleavage/methylation domain-containing protein
MKKHHSKRKGFTLIELLVVITIIGVLAGIAIGAFGGIFGQAGQLAAKDKLMDIHKGIVQAYKGQAKFPTSESLEEQTPAGFAVWFRKKTRNTESSLWFIDEDDRVLTLTDDGGAGKPSLIPTDPGGLDDEQKSAIGWTIAIPGEGASTKLDQNLASGPFPIMWTRGHDGEEWEADSPWSGEGGHVLFSNGKVEWYEKTANEDGDGVFAKPPAEDAADDADIETVNDPKEALPEGWDTLEISN